MPITVSGKISKLNDIDDLLCADDKITINTMAYKKGYIKLCERIWVAMYSISIDVKKINSEYLVFVNNSKLNTEIN